ncbi:MAG: hypothetical protein H6597_01565 [Flavobacteriales bacterium]|nr:hypothetical protein [Flavobacteriales bacterium]MCB9193195.1 hypothetical protein [Flavobacteriales bacterium]
MFIGHFALGMAAKRLVPRVSLGVLFIAAQFLDLLWPVLLLTGVEQARIVPGITALTPLDFTHYPISHSLVMATVWGVLVGVVAYLVRRNGRVALVLGALVLSHWVLDLLVHRPDLPISPLGGPKVGLGLWNMPVAALVLELGLFAWGVWVYVRCTTARDKVGRIGFWALVAFFLVVHLMNVLGPPPPNMTAVAWAGQLQWLFVLWAFWVDRHREATVG